MFTNVILTLSTEKNFTLSDKSEFDPRLIHHHRDLLVHEVHTKVGG